MFWNLISSFVLLASRNTISYCCVKYYPQNQVTINTYQPFLYLTVSVGQKFRYCLPGWFCCGPLVTFHLRRWLGLQSSKGLTGAAGSSSSMAQLCSWQVGAVLGGTPQFLFTWASAEQVIRKRAEKTLKCLLQPRLISHILLPPQHPVGYTGQLGFVWEGNAQEYKYQQMRIIRICLGC